MKIYPPSRGDDDRAQPSSADLKEFAQRLQGQHEEGNRRPVIDDDAWHWFLSLFTDRGRNEDTGDQTPRRAA